MLVVECLGASTVILYGLNLIWDPLYNDFEDDPKLPGVPKVDHREIFLHCVLITACLLKTFHSNCCS